MSLSKVFQKGIYFKEMQNRSAAHHLKREALLQIRNSLERPRQNLVTLTLFRKDWPLDSLLNNDIYIGSLLDMHTASVECTECLIV
jgi:hypothetical protein